MRGEKSDTRAAATANPAIQINAGIGVAASVATVPTAAIRGRMNMRFTLTLRGALRIRRRAISATTSTGTR